MHGLQTSDKVMVPDDHKLPYGRRNCCHAESGMSARQCGLHVLYATHRAYFVGPGHWLSEVL